MKQNERISIKKASMIIGSSKYTNIVFTLIFTAILARLLTPEDYGIVAITTVFTNFFILFSNMGIGPAVIQNKNLDRNDENKIFSFSLVFGVILGIIFFLFSFVLVEIYDNSVYIGIGAWLGVSIALATFNVVPDAVLMKNKRFLTVAIRTVTANVVGYFVALILAMHGGEYYSIVCQVVITALITFVWNEASVRLTVSFRDIGNSLNKIKNFSLYQMIFSLLNYFTRNIDNFLVGYYFGDRQLGLYDKAYKLVRYPVSGFTDVLVPVILPVLADYQDNKEYIIIKYFQFVKVLSLIAIYVMTVCFFSSKEIILLFFGNQWVEAVVPFKILSLTIWMQMIAGMIGSFYQCLDKTKYLFYSGVQSTFILLPSIFMGVYIGTIESLAICYTIGFILSFICGQWYLAHYAFEISAVQLFKQYIPELIMASILFSVMSFVQSSINLFISLVVKAVVAMIVYGVMLIVSKEYKHLLLLLPQKLKRKLLKKRKV